MNILVITRGSWNIDNNTGNTLEKLFCNLKNCNIYNLYMRDEEENNSCSKITFRISEQKLIKSWFFNREIGEIIERSQVGIQEKTSRNITEKKMYDFAKKTEFYLLWFIREIIWLKENWKSRKLDNFLEKIDPDIIFMPAYTFWYPYRILNYIYKKTNAKVVLFHADDNYSLKQYHFSAFYWLYRFILRKWIRKSVEISKINYCISEMQVEEYSKYFNKECSLLRKGYEKKNIREKKYLTPIEIVFTGNMSSGRWKTLRDIGIALDEINRNGLKVNLNIYTGTPLTRKMSKEFSKIFSIKFKGKISPTKVIKVQENADILLHVESFDLKDLLEVRLSFSTKIIDYINMKRCILAVGPNNIASIQYFIENRIGYVISDKKSIKDKLVYLLNKKVMKNYEKEIIKFVEEQILNSKNPTTLLYEDFFKLVNK